MIFQSLKGSSLPFSIVLVQIHKKNDVLDFFFWYNPFYIHLLYDISLMVGAQFAAFNARLLTSTMVGRLLMLLNEVFPLFPSVLSYCALFSHFLVLSFF